MLTDVDLPAPGLLWTRWATISAALSGIGFADVWFIDDRGAHRDDRGGSWARFALLSGGRAVLYGYAREHSATAGSDPPIDLLTGAPDWLPWDDLTPPAENDQLGFVVWHTEGRWSRSRYRDGLGDGLTEVVGAVLSTGNTLNELSEIVTEWGRHDLRTPSECDEVRAAGERLLASAVRGEVTGSAFERLLGRLDDPPLDLRAALFAAGRGGITSGTRPPRIAAGERPALRRVRRLSPGEHDRLVWSAMQDASDRRRPPPAATTALRELIDWLRGRAPGGRGRCSLLAYADSTGVSAQPGEFPPAEQPGEDRLALFRELTDRVRALREAESDPSHGRWFFLRVEVSAGGVQIERRYDSWPPWWPDDGVSGPWRTNLRQEMDHRAAPWRPSWTALLDPEVAYRPA
jgi:hypothetical protein